MVATKIQASCGRWVCMSDGKKGGLVSVVSILSTVAGVSVLVDMNMFPTNSWQEVVLSYVHLRILNFVLHD